LVEATLFTLIQALWALWWARLHLRIRKGRAYAVNRAQLNIDREYRFAGPVLFAIQNSLSVACFWASHTLLLKFHDNDWVRWQGVAVLFLASALYRWALHHLGTNYSPCYDVHAPACVVRTGPCRYLRHPMYCAKLMIGASTLLISGSVWFLPMMAYLGFATIRAMQREKF
jgi:protein-S-isoprenylcysteine O-methyltransferase Ste14